MTDAQLVLAFVFGAQTSTLEDKKAALAELETAGRGRGDGCEGDEQAHDETNGDGCEAETATGAHRDAAAEGRGARRRAEPSAAGPLPARNPDGIPG